jgi:hypothetical protein
MRLTRQDVGRVIRKRDNLMRRFVIIHVEGDEVTLEDLIFGQEFTITDVRTYEFVNRGQHNGHDETK